MRTMVTLADVAQSPCPTCGSTDVQRTPMPSNRTDGKEHITNTCAGCGEDRGSETKNLNKHRVRNHPLVYPKGKTAGVVKQADAISDVKNAICGIDGFNPMKPRKHKPVVDGGWPT